MSELVFISVRYCLEKFIQFLLQFANPTPHMISKKVELDKWAYKFTDPTIMKFQPKEDFQQPLETPKEGLVARIKNYFSPAKLPKQKKGLLRQTSTCDERSLLKKKVQNKPTIKFVKKLTNQHVLVGNQDQIDAMSIGGVINQFVDTEFLWSLNIKKAIWSLAIDHKKNYILALGENQVHIFKYEFKNMRLKPVVLFKVKLSGEPKIILVIREGTFTLCYDKKIEVHIIDEIKGTRISSQKIYELPNLQLKIYRIPDPYQNILNIFFEQVQSSTSACCLWNIEVQFYQKEIKISKALKAYEIPGNLRNTARIQNFSKTIYLINLGNIIYAVRKGYVIDKLRVDSMKSQNSRLKYLSNNRLIHVSDFKVQVYRFGIDQESHPPRIKVESSDSIQTPNLQNVYQYVQALQMLGDNLVVFYQLKLSQNKLLKGQTKYAFVVTNHIKMQEKIKNILPQELAQLQIEKIEEKADMAKKMGMQRKYIYLRLWQNSTKSTVEDFKLLLDTLDYDTIKAEIQKKLKKTSMNFREVLLLQQGCLSMLSQNVFSTKNTKQDVKNYLISHFLVRKLQLYRQITMAEKNQGRAVTQDPTGKLLINIQNYNNYKTIDLKSMLFEYIHRFCNQQKNQIKKIRILIKSFKFTFSIIYQDLLKEIVINNKKKFLKLLQAIPQILPYQPDFSAIEDDNRALYEGIWQDITDQGWQKNLYLDTFSTIDNKENLSQVCSNVWYKRYWLTQHDFINMNKEEIQKIHDLNNSAHTFYHVIQHLFDHIKEYAPLRQVIDYIQDNYSKMPQHIFGKIFLYRKLFDHFKENKHISKIEQIDSFANFLKLRDQDIFKAMFNYQKVKKGFILKEVKPLYQKLAGIEVFNEGLLTYFASPISQISDIKYLLNRMNNEKHEFHQQNSGIYQVLIRGMQRKLKVGCEDGVPIGQVLIYIENIPLLNIPSIQKDLEIMKLINEQSARFKKIKLNMSIFDMTKNADIVVAAIIHYQISQANLKEQRDINTIKDLTYRIIDDVEGVKKKLYVSHQYECLTLFTYLTQILQEQQLIPIVASLLEDQIINKMFPITQILSENLVLYNYKWKMTQTPAYRDSAPHLRQLVNLLPSQNVVRQFIQAEIEVAETLTSESQVVCYPLSKQSQYFTSRQLQNIIIHSPGSHLLGVNLEKLYEAALRVQELSSDGELSQITLNGIYQNIIFRLIECNMLKEVVPKIRSLNKLLGESPYNFIYSSLLVAKIAPEMIEQNRNLLLKCASYLFKQPQKLLDLVEQIMSIRATSSGYKQLILKYYSNVKHYNLNFSSKCQILQSFILQQIAKNEDLKKKLNYLLRYSLYNLLAHKQNFAKNPEHYIMYIILINEPKALVKYFYYNRYNINVKDFRCFFSFLIKDELFSKTRVLQFLKRLFMIIHESMSKNKKIETVIQEFYKVPLDSNMEFQKIDNPVNEFQQKISKSLDRLKLKIKTVHTQIAKRKAKSQEYEENKNKKLLQRLESPRSMQGLYEYPFVDSDDNIKTEQQKLKKQHKLKVNVVQPFDSKYQRQTLLKRSVKNLGLFVSVQKQKNEKNLYYTQKFQKKDYYGSFTLDKNMEKNLHLAIQNQLIGTNKLSRASRKLNLQKIQSAYMFMNDSEQGTQQLRISRSHAIQEVSEQEKHLIEIQQKELIKVVQLPALDDIGQENKALESIMPLNTEITENTQIPFENIDIYKENEKFVYFLKQLIKLAFNRTDISFRGIVHFIKKMGQRYPSLQVNQLWCATYLRAEALQKKFNLDLPLKEIFTFQGLINDSQIIDNLFHLLLPNIIKNSNEQNILKICKVITIAFKKPQMQQQILYYYLLELLNSYQSSLYNPKMTENDLNMMKDKLKMIIHKIPTKYLSGKDEEMIQIFTEDQNKKEIARMLIESFRSRYDMKSAQSIVDKYITKVRRYRKQGQA